MIRPFEAAHYTGTRPWAPMLAVPAGHCRRCGAPSWACRCGCRECRREAKELLVTPAAKQGTPGTLPSEADQARLDLMVKAMIARPQVESTQATVQAQVQQNLGRGSAFIGGGCCVSLSVEYAAQAATAPFLVLIEVTDSEGTMLAWGRLEAAGTPYRVKESVITTKPGATLVAVTSNATARVRWCEIFSCGC